MHVGPHAIDRGPGLPEDLVASELGLNLAVEMPNRHPAIAAAIERDTHLKATVLRPGRSTDIPKLLATWGDHWHERRRVKAGWE